MIDKKNNSFERTFKTKEELQAYMIDIKKKSNTAHTIGYGSKLILS